MKKVLVINGHPDAESFCTALANEYKKGADAAGARCEILHLGEMDFNPVLKYGNRKPMELEPDLAKAKEAVANADHLVFVYPNWWGTYPALLKGFIDRVFEIGFAYDVAPELKGLLHGRTAHLIVTTDTPDELFNDHYGRPGHNAMQKCVLEFCGIKPVKIHTIGLIHGSDEAQRKEWLKTVENFGREQQ